MLHRPLSPSAVGRLLLLNLFSQYREFPHLTINHGEILALRDAGCAILVVSEELDELFEVSDRMHVIARGKLSPSVPVAEATIEKIGEWMSGLWEVQHG